MKVLLFLVTLLIFKILIFSQNDWFLYLKAGEWIELKRLIGNELIIVLLITMGLMIMQNLFSFLPFLVLTMFNIWLFGFFYGYLWSLAGNIIGSVIVFYIARYFSQGKIFKHNHLKIKKTIEENGFLVILVSRITPVIPSSIINISCGMSNIKTKDYVLSTMFGHAIFVFVLSILSIGLISFEEQYIVYLFLFLIVVGITALKIKRKVSWLNV
ncbi:SNARE associated Golgi protein-like protein (plasmid) [Alkalihalophilus pseudofirmus OF4]|uniref:TVP38/TMEM64 family membrane protein n=6 Tax=Bacillaceae TaxID=186817 RepID=D3G145_ALKPO|nr:MULTISPECIES: VTT domain-containing protein [Bacillaceae]ADC52071.1 SNARE associated Golgi protein-like protein [Alkalihalophilus pseudofirmus OF4]KGA97943.1 hypothetical protein BALCAV_0207205 [Alkalihalobacillus alcalophilus ATCC 27647 = CGMCC 1.3604]KHF38232.1 hypothetical protein LQ50_22465 [Halalkalibacter okhensis]MCM3763081.1 VTT domain-containing protein [Halalkalibacter oceani]MED1562719.1 VTT domain-containing protein [Alkalihalobacillus alcalophilus]